MFKILSMALISLVGMQYANTSGNNIKYAPSNVPTIVGGTTLQNFNNGFFIPSPVNEFYYTGPTTYQDNYTSYSFTFSLQCDYLYFKTYLGNAEIMYDSREFTQTYDVDNYLFFISNLNGNFQWSILLRDSQNTILRNLLLAYYSYDNSTDLSGQELFYNDLNHYVLYLNGVKNLSYSSAYFIGYNGSSTETIIINSWGNRLPFVSDSRYRSLERNYYFPYQPVVYGYWYKDQNSTYYIPNLGSVGTISRPTIFKGYFKCNGEYFRSYRLDGINNQQPNSGGWYFGQYNNVSSLSNAIRPSSGTQFWFASGGLFEYFNNGVKPVWYTQSTPVVSSNVEYNVISNTYQWYSFFYQNIYLVYEEVDTSGNLTSISNTSYYDMLSFNTGFVSTDTDINPLTNALTLVGVAFQQLWSIGNIVLFGTITINSLILLPILVSLVIFIIHLIKRG